MELLFHIEDSLVPFIITFYKDSEFWSSNSPQIYPLQSIYNITNRQLDYNGNPIPIRRNLCIETESRSHKTHPVCWPYMRYEDFQISHN